MLRQLAVLARYLSRPSFGRLTLATVGVCIALVPSVAERVGTEWVAAVFTAATLAAVFSEGFLLAMSNDLLRGEDRDA